MAVRKEQARAGKRNEILSAARRLVMTKGYEQMTIQDILDELHISKGAFYHYFGSKQALLEALVEGMLEEIKPVLAPVIADPNLSALEKLRRYFDTAVRWKRARKDFLIDLMRVWYADDNAIVREKLLVASSEWVAPQLAAIIRQGIGEGVLAPAQPERVGEVAWALLQSLGNAMARQLTTGEARSRDIQEVESLVAAYTDALERILGAPAGSLQVFDVETLKEWFPVAAGNA
ncbi:MAG: TetR/AcrR family transcriptional regulator [Chloroflexi bacterium]|nr:TetR/AcrR family transcriptional regulator [Chloroflexota bacterium]